MLSQRGALWRGGAPGAVRQPVPQQPTELRGNHDSSALDGETREIPKQPTATNQKCQKVLVKPSGAGH